MLFLPCAALAFAPVLQSLHTPQRTLTRVQATASAGSDDHDILLRCARGEQTSRTPVWLMRQAGRYMAEFRAYSDKYPFRMRSETPEIAVELSLQPLRAFGVDGVVMFSDILTPLPALGVDFDVVKGTGPVIGTPLRTMEQVHALTPLEDPDVKLPFLREILTTLRKETDGTSTLIGFVGSPFTLVAYAVEGKANRHCIATKKMMMHSPGTLHAALNHFADAVGQYACHQIDCGAQVGPAHPPTHPLAHPPAHPPTHLPACSWLARCRALHTRHASRRRSSAALSLARRRR